MDKTKRTIAQYIIIAILAVAITAIMLHIMLKSRLNNEVSFSPDITVTDNPLMGYAPDASNIELCEKTNLVYIPITWAEWEPKEGEYDIEGLEKKYNIAKWKEENKHAVIRFMCDVPGKNVHYDIPKWLYDKTGSGTFYSTDLGKGYSPDYSDKRFMEYHKKAIEKLSEYCNKDHFVAFVEMGSIGHWGEWHATGNDNINLMPDADICLEYANLYSDRFTDSCLLTRRNYDFASEGGMGFYNDMIGAKEETDEWLEWIKNGAVQETSKDPLILSATDLKKAGPIGGEFTSSVPMNTIMNEGLGDSLASISASQMTFIGPMVPDLNSKDYEQACDSILRRMGYRIYVSNLKTQYNFADNEIKITLKFQNAGNAGFYFDWPITVYVFDKDLKLVYWEGMKADLRDLNSDKELTVESNVPVNDDLMNEFYVGVGITDYEGKEHIELAIENDDKERIFIDNAQIIYHYKK